MTEFEPKRLAVALDGCEHEVNVEQAGAADSFTIRVERGDSAEIRSLRLLARQPAPLVLVDGRVLRLSIGGERAERRVSRGPDARRARLGTNAEARETVRSATGLLLAPMPGRIVAVRVQVGDALEKGALLLVIEAMKMQNELFASGAGRVESVLVQPGDAVERGAALIEIV